MEKETLVNYDHKHPLVQSAFIDLQGVLTPVRTGHYIYFTDIRYCNKKLID